MLFHIGAIWRLHEAGILPCIARFSSVSGGSITAAVLGMNWGAMGLDRQPQSDRFEELFVKPVRELARRTIDEGAVIGGILLPGTIADKVTGAYRKHLFGRRTLADLPDAPRFIFNATNVQTGAVWRFSKPYMGDWRVGLVRNPRIELAVAVAASSAFPPVLSPLTLDLDPRQFTDREGADLADDVYRDRVVLTDGGVYDNLGLETAFKRCKTLLVSDAGQKMGPEAQPKGDWAQHSVRIMGLLDHQVRNLRKRQLIGAFTAGERAGTYWSIRSSFDDYRRDVPDLADPLILSGFDPSPLASLKTRLKSMDTATQERLINWGYAICDTALRAYVDSSQPAGRLPYPRGL
jgi:NTE family protein